MNKLFFFILVIVISWSCTPAAYDKISPYNSNTADFQTFVALGNSLTAGFADASLYPAGQDVAFPNIIHNQMKIVHPNIDSFYYPRISNTFAEGYITPRLHLYGSPSAPNIGSSPTWSQTQLTQDEFLAKDNYWSEPNRTFHNLGIPGAKVSHLMAPGFGSLGNLRLGLSNPYFVRLEANNATTSTYSSRTVVERAVNLSPTFFSLWIGSNDVLSYASSGGEESGNSITDLKTFTNAYTAILDVLLASTNEPQGILISIPSVVNVPYFNVVVSRPEANSIAGLIKFKDSKGVERFFDKTKDYLIPTGTNSLIAYSRNVILPANFDINKITTLFPNNFILDENEVSLVNTAINQYNKIIQSLANQKGLAYLDINIKLQELTTGLDYLGIELNNKFISGGIFSLDGIHLTPRGNAFLANEVIETINLKYSSNIPKVNILNYKGVVFE